MQRGSLFPVATIVLAFLLPRPGLGAEAPSGAAPVRSPAQSGTTLAWTGGLDGESVAIISQAGVVTLFTRTPAADWKGLNLSSGTGLVFRGSLKLWLLPGKPAAEQILATATTGEVFVFQRVGDAPFSTIKRTGCPGNTSCACNCGRFCRVCPPG